MQRQLIHHELLAQFSIFRLMGGHVIQMVMQMSITYIFKSLKASGFSAMLIPVDRLADENVKIKFASQPSA